MNHTNPQTVANRWWDYAKARGFDSEYQTLNPHIRNETQIAFYDGFAAAMRFMRCELPALPKAHRKWHINFLEEACKDMAVHAATYEKPAPVLSIAPIIYKK